MLGEECCCVVEGIPGRTTRLLLVSIWIQIITGVRHVLLMELENVLLVSFWGR